MNTDRGSWWRFLDELDREGRMHSTSKYATDIRSKWEIRRQHDPLADECNCGRCGQPIRKDRAAWVDTIGQDLCSAAQDSSQLHHKPRVS